MSTYASRQAATYPCPCPSGLLGCLAMDYEPKAVRVARQFVTQMLGARGYESVTDELELIVSELVTNAVQHVVRPTTGPLKIRLLVTSSTLRLEVYDSDRRLPLSRRQGTDDETGRGLHIVASLSTNTGAYRTSIGKCVWCEVEISSKTE